MLRGYPSELVQSVISDLAAAGALDDRRFALWWARSRAVGGWGSRLVSRELRGRGIAPAMVRETLACLAREHDEPAAARAWVERRLRRYQREPMGVRWRRLHQQLARRGYAPEIIEGTLREQFGEG